MEDWKPIETAPKDGTRICVKRDWLQQTVQWSHPLDDWVIGPGPDGKGSELLPWQPTHWVALRGR
jgi:hypothetical protein